MAFGERGIAGRISPVGRVWFRGTGCSDIQIRDAWQNVEQKLSSRPGWKKRHLTIYWSVAATVVIMLTAGWFLFRQSPVRTEPEEVVQITPGSLKAVWVLEGGEKYELSENLGRDITAGELR